MLQVMNAFFEKLCTFAIIVMTNLNLAITAMRIQRLAPTHFRESFLKIDSRVRKNVRNVTNKEKVFAKRFTFRELFGIEI